MTEMFGYAEPLSGLPIEYERDYGTAWGYTEIPDIFDHPVVFSPGTIDSFLSSEEFSDGLIVNVGSTGDDAPHP